MRRLLLFVLVGAFLLSWCSALIAEVPAEVKALLDKESTGQLTLAEKKIVSDYFDAQYKGLPTGTDTQWGPDGYGYTAKDPASGGEAYNWIDIIATGTEIWGGQDQDDTWYDGIPLPFSFPFYGNCYSTCDISANIIISFNSAHPSYSTAIPSSYLRIDPWVYDMYHLGTASHTYYKAFGDTMFVVSFIDGRYYNSTYRNDPTYGKTMQVIMWANGKVKFQYNDLLNIVAASPYASGIDDAGAYGVSVGSPNTNYYAITFYPSRSTLCGMVTPSSGIPSTNFNYYATFVNPNNTAPTTKDVYIDGTPYSMTDPGGNYAQGVTLNYGPVNLAAGVHNYYFYFIAGNDTIRQPASGTSTGPTVRNPMAGNFDIGGGANNFPTVVAAVETLKISLMTGPVTFSIYTGTYDGQINLPGTIPGLGATNTLTFQPGPGQSPIISSTGYGFYLTGADYVTIRGLRIKNCAYSGIYNYYLYTTFYDSSKFNQFIGNYIDSVGASYYAIQMYYGADCQIRRNILGGGYYGLYMSYSHRNIIANNMFLNSTTGGIYNYYSAYNSFYYNSVYNTGTYAFYNGYGIGTTFKDNILYQAGVGNTKYAFYNPGLITTYPLVSDYNDLYAPSANVGYYNSASRITLADWRTATGLDAQSISADPGFVNVASDLHVSTAALSPVDHAGTPVAGFTTDFDSETRNATVPDIGADEFTYTQNYCVELTPLNQRMSLLAGNSYDYPFTATNCGSVNDTYNLTVLVTGQAWTHEIRNAAGASIIDSLVVAAGSSGNFLVRVIVPAGVNPGLTSNCTVTATSRYGSFRNILSDNSYTTTSTVLGGNYDIGGGAMNFTDVVTAATVLATYGVGAPVNFNIYTGTYDGQVNLPAIAGVSATNRVTFRPAAGNTPVITSTTGHGFYLTGADYITIRNLEITNCSMNGIYNYYTGTDSSKFNYFIKNYIHNVGTSSTYAGIYLYYGADCQVRQNEIDGDYYGIYLYYSHRNLVCNNMIYNTGYYGIRGYYSNYNTYYYNSVLDGTAGYYAMYLYYGNTATVKDNIFYQLGTGSRYAYYNYYTAPLVSNYNDLYAPGCTYLAYYNGTSCANLLAWQTASGQDANSISADPVFQSLTDTPNLHITTINPSPVDSAGTPVAEVTVDIDNEARDAARPDIGADEFLFSVPGYYVDVEPELITGVGDAGDSLDYLFTVQNLGWRNDTYNLGATVISGQAWDHRIMDKTGTSVISSIVVNSGVIDTFLVRVTIGTGAVLYDTSWARIVAVSQAAPYRNLYSDTVWAKTTALIPVTLPYFSDFNSNNGNLSPSGTALWEWGTPTYASGPPTAYSPPYCWGTILASTYPVSCCGYLDTPPLEIIPQTTMTFWHWYYTETSFDGGNVKISTDGGASWILIYPVGGYPQPSVSSNTCVGSEPVYAGTSPGWVMATFDLSAFSGTTAMLRWIFGSDPSVVYPGWYIDDVMITGPQDYCVDVEPEARTGLTRAGDSLSYSYTIENCGSENDTYNLSVTVTGEPWTHRIIDKTGTSVISSIAVNSGVIDTFLVRAIAPSNATFGDTSFAMVVATSQNGRNILSDTVRTTSVISPWYQIPLNWVEIAGTVGGPGTSAGITGDDATSAPLPIGFDFPWYNCVFYNSVKMCTNGWASFTSTLASYYNYPLPSISAPFDLLAPFWDDLTLASTNNAWYYYDSANNRFIMEWYQATQLSGGGSFTFEIILHHNGGIDFMYNNMTYGTTLSNTVGIQNGDGTVGVQCTYDGSGPLPDPYTGLGVHVNPLCAPQDWCVDLGPEGLSCNVLAGGSIDYDLTVENCGANTDTYDLSTANVPLGWTATIMDASGTTVIDSIGPLNWQETAGFMVRLACPGGTPNGTYTADVIADSRYGSARNVLSDTVQVAAEVGPFSVVSAPYSENFDHAGANPVGWTIIDGGSLQDSSATWHAELEVAPDDYVMLSDADGEGSTENQDETLISPIIDCSGLPAVLLRFWTSYLFYDDITTIDIKVGCGAWQNVATYTIDASGTMLYDISPWAADQDRVQIRFHYITAWGYWWMIDDFYVGEPMPDVATMCIRVTPEMSTTNDCAQRQTGSFYDVWATIENVSIGAANVTVNASDDYGWVSSTTITGLLGGACTEVHLPNLWVGRAAGLLNTITVTAVATGDTVLSNNTLTKAVTVPAAGGTTLAIDDGTMANAWRFYDPVNNIVANQFTPPSYPMVVNWVAACIYGLAWPDATNDQVALSIWLEDPGNPGYPAEPPVWTELCMWSNGGTGSWIYSAPDLPVTISSGSFWVGFHEPNSCASVGNEGICVDVATTYASQNWARLSGTWQLYNPYAGDNMIRANVVAGAVEAVDDLVIEVYEVIDEVNTVRLSWSAVTGAAKYMIYETDDLSAGFTLSDSTTSTTWIDDDALSTEPADFYYVTASNVARDAGASSVTMGASDRARGPVATVPTGTWFNNMHQSLLARPEALRASSRDQLNSRKAAGSTVRTR